MNNEIQDKTYIPLTPFKGWVLENFPFIEANFDAITNYELMCKVTEYLNNVINNQNQVQELGTELVNAYNELLNYVNNYFDNLDLQEEVNTKIDEMATNGTLTNLIKGYVDPIYQAYETEINTDLSNYKNSINTTVNNQNTEISNFKTSVNTQINTMNTKVNNTTSGSPLVASSTDDMTDTTRVYVNTTDGKWYYYDGDSWEIGGTYQSTELADGSISYQLLDSNLQNYFSNIINGKEIDLLTYTTFEIGSIFSGADQSSNTRIRSDYIDVSNIRNIKITPTEGYKYLFFGYTAKNSANYISSTYGSLYSTTFANWKTDESYCSIHPAIKYIRVVIADTSDSTSITPSDASNVKFIGDYPLLDEQSNNDIMNKPYYAWLKDSTYIINPPWIQGIPGAGATTTTLTASSTRIMTTLLDIENFNGNLILSTESGYQAAYYIYDKSFNKLTERYWVTSYNLPIPANAKYLVIGLSKTNSDSITPSDAENNITISLTSPYNIQKIENISNNSNVDLGWEIGSLSSGTGFPTSASNRLRSGFIYVGKGTILENTDTTTYEHLYYKYDLTKTYISDESWTQNKQFIIDNDCYIRILIRKVNGNNITTEEISTIASKEKIYRTFPQSMIQNNIDNNIPSYFVNNINTAIENSLENITDTGINGDTFVFLTDVHWQNNEKHSPALINKACENLNINKIICGGDLIGGGNKSDMIDLMNDCVNSFKDITRFYCLFGNHDSNKIGSSSASDYLSKSEAYSLIQKQTDFVMNYATPCYFYYDNPTTKTRYICLDTGEEGTTLDSDQSSWLSSTLSSMPTGYHALIFMHIICALVQGETWHIGLTAEDLVFTEFMYSVISIIDSFNTNNNDKKVEAVFGGHVHIDCNFETSGGIPIVMTDCDCLQTFTETASGSGIRNAIKGTITEQCFDITTIDYENKIIKCSRVGRGSDRTITY